VTPVTTPFIRLGCLARFFQHWVRVSQLRVLCLAFESQVVRACTIRGFREPCWVRLTSWPTLGSCSVVRGKLPAYWRYEVAAGGGGPLAGVSGRGAALIVWVLSNNRLLCQYSRTFQLGGR